MLNKAEIDRIQKTVFPDRSGTGSPQIPNRSVSRKARVPFSPNLARCFVGVSVSTITSFSWFFMETDTFGRDGQAGQSLWNYHWVRFLQRWNRVEGEQ
jgi:hypothetical protein